jgi:hypothetical protein
MRKGLVFVRPKKEVISLRLEPKLIRRLRELADKEGLPPTAYVRMLIVKSIQGQTKIKVFLFFSTLTLTLTLTQTLILTASPKTPWLERRPSGL